MADTPTTSGEPCIRSVYLITYSHADENKVANKETFSTMVIDSFQNNGQAKVLHWACGKEAHSDGTPHYHLVIKLDRQKRWRSVRNYLSSQYGVCVNFSNEFTNYYDGYMYVSKEDTEVLHSDNHPPLTNPYRTDVATRARRQGKGGGKKARKRSFDAVDLSDVVHQYHLRDKTDLLHFVKQQKMEGKRDLPLFVLNNVEKAVKIVNTVWEMENAENIIQRRSIERMQLLNAALLGQCVPECNGQWLVMATETLANNNIPLRRFCAAITDALENGRGKDRNVLLVGGGNSGKTFLLKPLRKIYTAFSNPATGSFAWLGVENAEVIFLNDFRWERTIISWKDFLLLLEGDELHFPAPKTTYAHDILFNKDTPIFATADQCFEKGPTFAIENYMMTLRWNIFNMTYEIPRTKVKTVQPCAHCFAELLINN